MEEDTIVECLCEIATGGEYEWFAKDQVCEQLRKHGYSGADIDVVIEVATRAKNTTNVKCFAEALFAVVSDKANCDNYIYDADVLYALCLIMSK